VPAAGVPGGDRGPRRIHHVALIVRSIEAAVPLYADLLGLPLETVMDIPGDRVRIAFLAVGESKVELVEPTDDTTGVARFLATRGEGFHHVCYEVANLAEELTRLAIDGVELIDSAPRRGAEGPVAFIHPRSGQGVLIELIEAPGGPAWRSLGYPLPPGEAGAARPRGAGRGQARRAESRKSG
jgi:methylmalonyl-CoA/ethylmalonyl-CoA epimerase